MKVEPIDVSALEIDTDLPNLRRDLHVFVDYVASREIKRSHRENLLSKSDGKRLAKLLSDSQAAEEVDRDGSASWIEFVDDVALKLGFVHYETKGSYAGYSSVGESFPNNYIKYQADRYEKFLQMTAARQESTLLEALIREGQGSESEFYVHGALGRLTGFNRFGSAVGVMPTLDFPPVRRFLLKVLAACPGEQWLSTASLVEQLKKNHRYFLIPARPKVPKGHAKMSGRYDNFHESINPWGTEIVVKESDPDGFERVEGRYVERFLEGLPLVLRYVDVAYAEAPEKAIYPPLGQLKAFRVSARLGRALTGSIAEPQVIVAPNFEVHVIAETYPASVLAQLAPFCEPVSEGSSFVLKLTKQKVATARAAVPDRDPVALLRSLGGEIPANVAHELATWAKHGEKFTLYLGCAVLETEKDAAVADPYTTERVADGIRLVRSADQLFDVLERSELVPLRIQHGSQDLTPLPKSARTCFPKKSAAREKPLEPRVSVTLFRVTRVQLVCPNRALLDLLHGLLLEHQVPVEVDQRSLTLTYSKPDEPTVTNAIRQLKTQYQIKIEDGPS